MLDVLSPQILCFEDFLTLFSVPKACELNKPIFKKTFIEATDGKKPILTAIDKKLLKNDVDRISWLYTLKPSTINIAAYKDQEREYPEVAILHIQLLKIESQGNKAKRIAHFINRAIPYPLVLLFTCNTGEEQLFSMVLADKRVNQADKEKWVIEDSFQTRWINLLELSAIESEFISNLTISKLPFSNFFAFYQALIDSVVALKCADLTGTFSLRDKSEGHSKNGKAGSRVETLREIEKLELHRTETINKVKKVKQMGKQVELNTQANKLRDAISALKAEL